MNGLTYDTGALIAAERGDLVVTSDLADIGHFSQAIDDCLVLREI